MNEVVLKSGSLCLSHLAAFLQRLGDSLLYEAGLFKVGAFYNQAVVMWFRRTWLTSNLGKKRLLPWDISWGIWSSGTILLVGENYQENVGSVVFSVTLFPSLPSDLNPITSCFVCFQKKSLFIHSQIKSASISCNQEPWLRFLSSPFPSTCPHPHHLCLSF